MFLYEESGSKVHCRFIGLYNQVVKGTEFRGKVKAKLKLAKVNLSC